MIVCQNYGGISIKYAFKIKLTWALEVADPRSEASLSKPFEVDADGVGFTFWAIFQFCYKRTPSL